MSGRSKAAKERPGAAAAAGEGCCMIWRKHVRGVQAHGGNTITKGTEILNGFPPLVYRICADREYRL